MTQWQSVTLDDVRVMFIESDTGLAGASKAFDRLEAHFPTLKGRKFYGTFMPPAGPIVPVSQSSPATTRQHWRCRHGPFREVTVPSFLHRLDTQAATMSACGYGCSGCSIS